MAQHLNKSVMAQWNIPFESLLTKVSDSHRKMYVDGSAGRDINPPIHQRERRWIIS